MPTSTNSAQGTRYVEIALQEGGRTYTYACDDDVGIGDEVEVNTPNGALLRRPVLNIRAEAPSFQCKPAWKV